MAFAVLSCVVDKTIIEEKRCVGKTWPNFFDDLQNQVSSAEAKIALTGRLVSQSKV